jgi:hypothetical protein
LITLGFMFIDNRTRENAAKISKKWVVCFCSKRNYFKKIMICWPLLEYNKWSFYYKKWKNIFFKKQSIFLKFTIFLHLTKNLEKDALPSNLENLKLYVFIVYKRNIFH